MEISIETRMHSSRMRTARLLSGGLSARGGGVCSGGVVCSGGAGKACWDTHPLWTEFMTHTSENITLPLSGYHADTPITIKAEAIPQGQQPSSLIFLTLFYNAT